MGLDMVFVHGDAVFAEMRNHPDLHGWMLQHPGTPNGVEITPALLDDLEVYIDTPDKARYSGAFWGVSTPEKWEATRQLVPQLRRLLAEGVVYYQGW